jgi:hypothetical protein
MSLRNGIQNEVYLQIANRDLSWGACSVFSYHPTSLKVTVKWQTSLKTLQLSELLLLPAIDKYKENETSICSETACA